MHQFSRSEDQGISQADVGENTLDAKSIPHRSGLYTWLLQQVREHLSDTGAQLIVHCYQLPGDKRYPWLLEQLKKEEFGQAGMAVVQAFEQKRRDIAARARLATLYSRRSLYQQKLSESSDISSYQQRLDRTNKNIERHRKQGVLPPPCITIREVFPVDQIIEEQHYPHSLPLALKPWYVYHRRYGDCIVCALDTLYQQDHAPTSCLRCIPIQTARRALNAGSIQITEEGYVLLSFNESSEYDQKLAK